MTAEDQQAIKDAIAKATTLQEIERLTQLLRSGQLPSQEGDAANGQFFSTDE